jgi:hypothetical protein
MEFIPPSKPFNTKAAAVIARLKYPEVQRKTLSIEVILN